MKEPVVNSPFTPNLQRAIAAETHMRATRAFDTEFFAKLEAKQAQSRTWSGRLNRLFEVEISGVAVWRLLAPCAAGSVLPALVVASCLSSAHSAAQAPPPPPRWASLSVNQRRFWEEAAWKNPTRATLIALLDPNYNPYSNWGGAPCAGPSVA